MSKITIPPEAVEAAAIAAFEYYTAKEWWDSNQSSKTVWRNMATAALRAGIEAWPGMRIHRPSVPPRPPAPHSPSHKERDDG